MPFVIDELLILCKDCGAGRMATAEACRGIRSAADLQRFLETSVGPCPKCGGTICDVQVRLPDAKQPS